MVKIALDKGAIRECFGIAGVHVNRIRCRFTWRMIRQSPVFEPERIDGEIRRSDCNREKCMNKFAIRVMALTMVSGAFVTAQLVSAYASGSDTPSAPSSSSTKEKKKGDKSSSIEDPKFLAAYRTAYTTIYDHNDYTGAIDQLKALGREDVADVANLIGYSYRKLGNYQLSQVYYERALQDDPNHVRTWQYYGLWQLEQGNREQAEYHLNKIAMLVGTDSKEYRSLASALEQPPGTGLVY
jgi:Tetratricopeptide repeat